MREHWERIELKYPRSDRDLAHRRNHLVCRCGGAALFLMAGATLYFAWCGFILDCLLKFSGASH